MFDLPRITASNLVARVDYHDSIGSTSDRALELAAEGGGELPLLVLTERQMAGRGRGANKWWASAGALTFSLVLEAPPEKLPISRWPQVALVAGLAVCEALEGLVPGAELRVKWPNDVYLGGRKVCGILSESVPGWRDRLVVGVGVNVNNRVQGIREEVQSPKSKVQSPKSKVQGPRSKVQGPRSGGRRKSEVRGQRSEESRHPLLSTMGWCGI